MKYKVLQMLEEAQGSVSGEEIAQKLGISRQAVSKHVSALKIMGHDVTSKKSHGYELTSRLNSLSPVKIEEKLTNAFYRVEIKRTVSSTNDLVKEWAKQGIHEGVVLVSTEQTRGKGRMGRTFHSPPGGVYFSILLRPKLDMSEAVLVTAAGAVAVCRAIRSLTGIKAEIKWVNDVYCEGKKLCGILSEAAFDLESGFPSYIVTGMGINVSTSEFPKELTDIATSLEILGARVDVNDVVAGVLNEFYDIYNSIKSKEFLQDYRSFSCVLGRSVTLSDGSVAKATEINDEANLIVEYEDGTKRTVASGEISVKVNSSQET